VANPPFRRERGKNYWQFLLERWNFKERENENPWQEEKEGKRPFFWDSSQVKSQSEGKILGVRDGSVGESEKPLSPAKGGVVSQRKNPQSPNKRSG